MDMVFSKPLTQTDKTKRFAIPTHSLPWFPSFPDGCNNIEIEVWDNDTVKGKMFWKFTVSIRETGNYPKPVFSKGWLDFVRAKGLEVGDEVRLYRKQDTAGLLATVVHQLRYYIEVVKEAEEFGARPDAAAGVAAATA